MKTKHGRPAKLLLPISEEPVPEGFVSLEFLPFAIEPEDWRPSWAERGARRKRWSTLTRAERLFVLGLLGIPVQRRKELREVKKIAVAKLESSVLRKLNMKSRADLLELHRSANIAFQQRAWANAPT